MAHSTVFAQVMSLGHREVFRRCVERYGGDAQMKSFSCHDQWLAMAFAQLTHRESLRDLTSALGSRAELLYPMGFRGPVLRSTLADANEQRDWRIYADWAQALIRRARQLSVNDPFAVDLDQTIYAFDATVIDLSLTLFPWAHFRLRESAIKLHTLLDLRGSIPTFLALTKATVNEMLLLDKVPKRVWLRTVMSPSSGLRFCGSSCLFASSGARPGPRLRSPLRLWLRGRHASVPAISALRAPCGQPSPRPPR